MTVEQQNLVGMLAEQEQRETIFMLYLGMHVLRTMTRAAKLPLASARASGLIEDVEKHFPFVVDRMAELHAKP